MIGQWGDPISTSVGADFLNGSFTNPFNSIFNLPGQYFNSFEVDGQPFSFRYQILETFISGDYPVFPVATGPATLGTFALRGTDRTDGTTSLHNFIIQSQTDDFCLDFSVTPTTPGGPLAGTYTTRTRNPDGTCGNVVAADHSASIVPVGGEGVAGTCCKYRVETPGTCSGLSVGSEICLPCAGTCRSFPGPLAVVLEAPPPDGFAVCDSLQVSAPLAGSGCSRGCNAIWAIGLLDQ